MNLRAVAVLSGLGLAAASHGQVTFTPLGDLFGGVFESYAHCVSNNGVVYGATPPPGPPAFVGFRWTQATGMTHFQLTPDSEFSPWFCSDDGNVVIGHQTASSTTPSRAARYNVQTGAAQGLEVLDALYDYTFIDCSGSGDIVIGTWYTGTYQFGVYWNASGEMTVLPSPPIGPGSFEIRPVDISDDGRFIAQKTRIGTWNGSSVVESYNIRIVRISPYSETLTCLGSTQQSSPTLVTNFADQPGQPSIFGRNATGLPTECRGTTSVTTQYVVKKASTDLSVRASDQYVRVPGQAGWIDVRTFLINNGVPSAAQWSSFGITDVSANGRYLVGSARNPQGNMEAFRIDRTPGVGLSCDSINFNNDGSFFDPTDIEAFLSVFSEGPCIPAGATCNDVDFNNDGAWFDPCDIDSFLLVFSEGPCTLCGV